MEGEVTEAARRDNVLRVGEACPGGQIRSCWCDRGQVGAGRRVVGEAKMRLTSIVYGGRRSGSETERGWGEHVSLGKAQLKMQFDSTCEVVKMFGQDVT